MSSSIPNASAPSDEQDAHLAAPPHQQHLAAILRERILDGDYPPGHRLVERSLASELGVSRLPVRDALNILRGEGFVSAFPNRGMVVTPLSAKDVEELFEVRESLEVLAVRRATERATPEQLAGLERAVTESESAWARSDTAAVGRCNQEFHDLLWRMAHNSLLSSLMEPLEGRMHWLLRQNNDPRPLQAEHVALLAAIKSGDPELAAAQALEHVRTSRNIWLDLEARKKSRQAPGGPPSSRH